MNDPENRGDRPDSDPWSWVESERVCPECGFLVWERGWWDDPEEAGGDCIGTEYECTVCGWWEQC